MAGKYLPLISGSGEIISGDVTSGDVISGDATSGNAPSGDEAAHDHPQMINGWCIYTTNTEILNNKIKRTLNKIEHICMYLVVEGISIPIIMLCLSSL